MLELEERVDELLLCAGAERRQRQLSEATSLGESPRIDVIDERRDGDSPRPTGTGAGPLDPAQPACQSGQEATELDRSLEASGRP